MKKNQQFPDHERSGIKKLLIVMKLTTVFLFLSVMAMAASTFSQNSKFDLAVRDASIIQVFDEIERVTDYGFLFKTDQMDLNRKYTLEFKNVNIEKILKELLGQDEFSYRMIDRNIVITQSDVTSSQDVVGKKVTGKVTDSSGGTLPGVSVVVKGTTTGTITDFDGNYSLSNVPLNATLHFSFVGMKMQELPVGSKSEINVSMDEDAIGIEEVVAVGYGVQKKSVVTGSISSISSEDLMQARPSRIDQALNGRAAGVTITQNSGQPGGIMSVAIRGVGTNGNNSPLFIVDGLPMSDMNSINPNDVESMEVLKDATSTAIYGARGANGVILITTKKGKEGKVSLTYDGFYGSQQAMKLPEVLNSDQYLELMKEFYANDKTAYPASMPSNSNGISTDWLDEIFNTAPVTEHNITATFGNEKGVSLFSLGYRGQEGIVGGGDNSFFKRYTARWNSSYQINDFLKVGSNFNFARVESRGVGEGTNGYNVVNYAVIMDPTTPVYDSKSLDTFGYGSSSAPYSRIWNPLAFIRESGSNRGGYDRVYGNAFIELTPIKGLVIKSDFGINNFTQNNRTYAPVFYHSVNASNTISKVTASFSKNFNWNWDNTITYTKSISDHNFSVLLGTTAYKETGERFDASRQSLPVEALNNEDLWYLNAGLVATSSNTGNGDVDHMLASYFGRLSYNYKEKYLAEAIVRRDGSSNFGPNNKFATFPAFSLGWNVSNEEFFDVANFNYLKFRASWGQNGNESINSLQYTSVMSATQNYALGGFTNEKIYVGQSPSSISNPNIQWERSEQLDFGADLGFWKNKLTITMDYFKKTTKGLLFVPTVEAVRGNISSAVNVGSIRNSGFEFQAKYSTNINELKLTFAANASYLKNKVLSVGNKNGYVDGGWWIYQNVTRMEVDKPIGYFRGYEIDGIFQTADEINAYKNKDGVLLQPKAVPGDFKWQDTNGDGSITTDDKTDLGNPWPKVVYGGNINAEYRNLDLSVFFSGRAGNKLWYSGMRSESFGRANLPVEFLNRWQKTGDNAGIPRLSVLDPNLNWSNPSDFWVKNASYLKIGSIELGYTLPANILNELKINRVRIYGAIDNVYTFTEYPWFDPEVGTMTTGNILATGLDYGMYPQARTFRFGISVQF